MTSIPNLTFYVPAPSHYNTVYDWKKRDPEHTQKMVKGPVNSYLDKIVRHNKSPEKSTPSPLVYQDLDAWKHSSKALKTIGNQKYKDVRTTFVMVQESLANETPAAIYKTVSPVS